MSGFFPSSVGRENAEGQGLAPGLAQRPGLGPGRGRGGEKTIGDVAAEVAAAFGFRNRNSGPQHNNGPGNVNSPGSYAFAPGHEHEHSLGMTTMALTSEKTSFASVKGR